MLKDFALIICSDAPCGLKHNILSNSAQSTNGFYLKVKQMCSACVCWITIPWDAVAQRDVQKVMLEAFPSDATRHQSKGLR